MYLLQVQKHNKKWHKKKQATNNPKIQMQRMRQIFHTHSNKEQNSSNKNYFKCTLILQFRLHAKGSLKANSKEIQDKPATENHQQLD